MVKGDRAGVIESEHWGREARAWEEAIVALGEDGEGKAVGRPGNARGAVQPLLAQVDGQGRRDGALSGGLGLVRTPEGDARASEDDGCEQRDEEAAARRGGAAWGEGDGARGCGPEGRRWCGGVAR